MSDKTENKLKNLNETVDTTAEFDPKDIEQNKVISLFAYLGILVLIPIFGAKDSKFARFHSNQGLLLLIAGLAWGVVCTVAMSILGAISASILSLISIVLGVASLAFLALMIIGIINALNGKAKELPVIGKYRLLK